MNHTFESLKSQIRESLNEKFNLANFPGESTGYSIVEGFVIQYVQDQTNSISIGGRHIITVAVVGNSTGLVYYFALKGLLPDIVL